MLPWKVLASVSRVLKWKNQVDKSRSIAPSPDIAVLCTDLTFLHLHLFPPLSLFLTTPLVLIRTNRWFFWLSVFLGGHPGPLLGPVWEQGQKVSRSIGFCDAPAKMDLNMYIVERD